jgi:hypothetical protein
MPSNVIAPTSKKTPSRDADVKRAIRFINAEVSRATQPIVSLSSSAYSCKTGFAVRMPKSWADWRSSLECVDQCSTGIATPSQGRAYPAKACHGSQTGKWKAHIVHSMVASVLCVRRWGWRLGLPASLP